MHGRLLQVDGTGGRLADEAGCIDFVLSGDAERARAGDIVSIEGRADGRRLEVERVHLWVRPRAAAATDWEGRDRRLRQRRAHLRGRAAVVEAVRAFFTDRGFLEVETPTLALAAAQEAHIELFQSEYRGKGALPCWLLSSPELHMKRLLGQGCERIFQVGRCYRNGERSPLHNPEFTMVEWYRAYAGYEQIMEDTEELFDSVARAVRGEERSTRLRPPWKRVTVRQAFAEWAGIDLDACADAQTLRARSRERGFASVDEGDDWQSAFFKILLEAVEPALRELGAAFLVDYPASMASLARLREDDGRVAERFEAYVDGVELCNGFSELTDPGEQRRRFEEEQSRRAALGKALHPLDEAFLQMLEEGMPPAGGNALGVDRLAMLVAGTGSIDEVMAFPFAG